jgi:hypothetical protein
MRCLQATAADAAAVQMGSTYLSHRTRHRAIAYGIARRSVGAVRSKTQAAESSLVSYIGCLLCGIREDGNCSKLRMFVCVRRRSKITFTLQHGCVCRCRVEQACSTESNQLRGAGWQRRWRRFPHLLQILSGLSCRSLGRLTRVSLADGQRSPVCRGQTLPLLAVPLTLAPFQPSLHPEPCYFIYFSFIVPFLSSPLLLPALLSHLIWPFFMAGLASTPWCNKGERKTGHRTHRKKSEDPCDARDTFATVQCLMEQAGSSRYAARLCAALQDNIRAKAANHFVSSVTEIL